MPSTDPITLGAASVRAELREAPESHGINEAQADFIAHLSDDEIDRVLHDAADDRFWNAYYSVRRDAIAQLFEDHRSTLEPLGDELVPVVFLDGDDYEQAVDEANASGGSTEAVVEHLAQWDYGVETDGASEINGRNHLDDLKRLPHQLHEVDHGGLHYWLQIDHGLRFYALHRRPLGANDNATHV